MQLVTLDLDGTLIGTTVFQAAADGLGFGPTVEAIDARYFAGEASLEETFEETYPLFLGRRVDEVHEALAQGPWLENIAETVARLKALGLEVWVVTDQPVWAVTYLTRHGLTEGVFSETADEGGRIGPVTRQVFEKWPALETRLRAAGIAPAEVVHVGNGTNDLPIFARVGRSIAFNPSGPEVSRAADKVIEAEDLSRILGPIEAWVAKGRA